MFNVTVILLAAAMIGLAVWANRPPRNF